MMVLDIGLSRHGLTRGRYAEARRRSIGSGESETYAGGQVGLYPEYQGSAPKDDSLLSVRHALSSVRNRPVSFGTPAIKSAAIHFTDLHQPRREVHADRDFTSYDVGPPRGDSR